MGTTTHERHRGLINEGDKSSRFGKIPTFDKLRLSVPIDAILDYRPDIEPPDGVNGISVWPDGAVFTITSKVLRERYAEILSTDTIMDAFNLMNESGCLMIDPGKVMDATGSTVDRTMDLRLSRPPIDYLRALRLACPEKWRPEKYGNTGLALQNSSKSFNERLSFYEKYQEIRRNPIEGVDPEIFRNVLRVEYRISTAKKIRDRFEIPDVKLQTILSAPVNPALVLLESWRDRFATDGTGTSFKVVWDRMAAERLLERFDPSEVEVWIKANSGKPSTYMPKIRAALDSDSRSLLDEVIEKLIEAG